MGMVCRLLVLGIRCVKIGVLGCLFEAFEGVFERVFDVLAAEGAIGRIMCGRGVIDGALRLIGRVFRLRHVALVMIKESVHSGSVRISP